MYQAAQEERQCAIPEIAVATDRLDSIAYALVDLVGILDKRLTDIQLPATKGANSSAVTRNYGSALGQRLGISIARLEETREHLQSLIDSIAI